MTTTKKRLGSKSTLIAKQNRMKIFMIVFKAWQDKKALTFRELLDMVSVSKATLWHHLVYMCENGWIKKVLDPNVHDKNRIIYTVPHVPEQEIIKEIEQDFSHAVMLLLTFPDLKKQVNKSLVETTIKLLEM
ncbi:hypothetical protein E3J74_09130 [Candidatus Bathyarchaeota archaeon]|nr:MAG: hypothetical protein E3J74_09130 [Candidatus Bathyarchaeota archaeon]